MLSSYSKPVSCSLKVERSEDEWPHGFASSWVVLEFLLVSLVLLDGPDGHLVGGKEEEEVSSKSLRLDGESGPCHGLIEVVCA